MRPIPSAPARASAPFAVVLSALLLAAATAAAAAPAPVIERIRHYSAPEYTRVVLDLSRPARFELRRVGDPDRVVVNVPRARFTQTAPIPVGDGLVAQIRRNAGATRAQLVLDLAYDARCESFSLPAGEGRPARIVVDVFRRAGDDTRQDVPAPPVALADPEPGAPPSAAPPPGSPSSPAETESPPGPPRPVRVILDPGHGGMDPGAIRGKVREKDVVLAVCLEAKAILDAIPGYETVLTRTRDYYPSLARRVEIAREQRGDLFLSVHCNTHPRPAVAGMEVYFLSLQGATDREAQELADKENAADLVGLAPGEVQGDAVMSILMDLRMTQVLQQSSRLAESVLAEAGAARLATRRVKQARFQVLRTLAMPAALVELAYLSHAEERQLLASRAGQRRFAEALVAGILRFRRDGEALAALPPSTAPAERADDWPRKYRVRRGDSLWRLAERHGTTMEEIARRNNLRDRSLRIGQSLRLPEE